MDIQKTFFTLDGRLSRLPYFKCIVMIWIISAVVAWLIDSSSSTLISLIGIVVSLAMIGVSISFSVRRLHDIDKSGWFLLIAIIPLIGFLFQLYLIFAKGTEGVNRFGEDPLQQSY